MLATVGKQPDFAYTFLKKYSFDDLIGEALGSAAFVGKL